ncbi:hypothetical protein EK21DRAFT_55191 [Setomelanomma holmii]|uniref:Uncharacterized protein n=1 Tax=Setomelanomma holmii TaxID=210430 RepID=A0A9P4HKE0_9PLEO|nr:hypothetical protein EK21DRAFT_55191 [Setomelanomma holmii]
MAAANASTTHNLSVLRPQQPYTAAFLAHLSTFILHTPRPRLKSLFHPTLPSAPNIPALSLDLESPKPDALTLAACRNPIRILNRHAALASPDTIPYALGLLLRFRMIPRDSCDISDETWIIVAVYLACKWLTKGGEERLKCWAALLEANAKRLANAEKDILELLDHRIWILDAEYIACKSKSDEIWREVYSKVARPSHPPFMSNKFGRLG